MSSNAALLMVMIGSVLLAVLTVLALMHLLAWGLTVYGGAPDTVPAPTASLELLGWLAGLTMMVAGIRIRKRIAIQHNKD